MKATSKLISGGLICLFTVSFVNADVVTKYTFDGDLFDSAVAGVADDHLTLILIGVTGGESYEAGLVGQAVRLNTVADSAFVLTAPTSDDLNLAADWTIEAFVDPDFQNAGEWDRFWTKWGEGSNDWHWAFRYGNNGEDFFMNGAQVFDGAGGADNTIPLDEWSHVAVVGDSTAGTISGYLNGSQVVSGAYSAPVPGASNMNFGNFAHGGVTNDLQFTGLIDEAMIHNSAVSETYLLDRADLLPTVEPPDMSTAPPPSDTGLVSYYTFDSTIDDVASGFAQNIGAATDNLTPRDGAASYEEGLIGDALRIGVEAGDLTDLRAPVSADVNLPSTYTIEAWIKPTELDEGWQRLVLNWGGSDFAYHFAIRNNGGFANGVSLFHGEAGGGQPNANGGTVIADQWQHVAGVADGTQLSVYLDGELVAQTPYDGTIHTAAAEGLGIGDSDTSLSAIKYNGLIDDLAIWSVALTPEQIRYQFKNGLAGIGATVPEPSSLALLFLGVWCVWGTRRRRMSS